MMVPSIQARDTVDREQKVFTDGCDPLFIGYSAGVYLQTCETKINSWTTEANKMRGPMPPKYEVREVNKVLERAGFENKEPLYDSGRMIVKRVTWPKRTSLLSIPNGVQSDETSAALTSVSRYPWRLEEPHGGRQI